MFLYLIKKAWTLYELLELPIVTTKKYEELTSQKMRVKYFCSEVILTVGAVLNEIMTKTYYKFSRYCKRSHSTKFFLFCSAN